MNKEEDGSVTIEAFQAVAKASDEIGGVIDSCDQTGVLQRRTQQCDNVERSLGDFWQGAADSADRCVTSRLECFVDDGDLAFGGIQLEAEL